MTVTTDTLVHLSVYEGTHDEGTITARLDWNGYGPVLSIDDEEETWISIPLKGAREFLLACIDLIDKNPEALTEGASPPD